MQTEYSIVQEMWVEKLGELDIRAILMYIVMTGC